jgi:formamidopyrimidine-DNA glycosylase
MPEGPEITILSQFLMYKLQNKVIGTIEILSGKYKRTGIDNINIVQNKKIIKIDSKGKLMWFELENDIYIISHLGLTGFWSFTENNNDRLKLTIGEKILYYNDSRNFGNFNILTKSTFNVKISLLADDALKTPFTNEEFEHNIKLLNPKSIIVKVLMDQHKLLSGLGNYLTAEILYNSKLKPSRTLQSLSTDDIYRLAQSIRYIIKLSYFNNSTGYMESFGNYLTIHKKKILDGSYPNFHPLVKLKKTDKFIYHVYQQKLDKLGNIVCASKEYIKDRTTYWVPTVQI